MRRHIGEVAPPTYSVNGYVPKTSPLHEGDTLNDGWGVTWMVVEMRGYDEAVIRLANR